MAAESFHYRKWLTRAVTFFGGLYFVLEFLLPERVLKGVGVAQYHDQISFGFITVGVMALGLGLINLGVTHGGRILYRRKGASYSFVLLASLLITMSVTTLSWMNGLTSSEMIEGYSVLSDFTLHISEHAKGSALDVKPPAERIEFLKAAIEKHTQDTQMLLDKYEGNTEAKQALLDKIKLLRDATYPLTKAVIPTEDEFKILASVLEQIGVAKGQWYRSVSEKFLSARLYTFIFEGLFVSLGAAMFSLLSVYIAVAAYRAFRIRTLESSLMMTAAVLVILGQTSFGLWLSPEFPVIRQWLMEVPNGAAFRAIRIGSAVAGLVMAFRMWLSIESESFSEDV